MGDDGIMRTTLQLPVDLHARLKAIARKEERSLQAQILVFLRGCADEYEDEQVEAERRKIEAPELAVA